MALGLTRSTSDGAASDDEASVIGSTTVAPRTGELRARGGDARRSDRGSESCEDLQESQYGRWFIWLKGV